MPWTGWWGSEHFCLGGSSTSLSGQGQHCGRDRDCENCPSLKQAAAFQRVSGETERKLHRATTKPWLLTGCKVQSGVTLLPVKKGKFIHYNNSAMHMIQKAMSSMLLHWCSVRCVIKWTETLSFHSHKTNLTSAPWTMKCFEEMWDFTGSATLSLFRKPGSRLLPV